MTIQMAKVISKGIITITYDDTRQSNHFVVRYRKNGHNPIIGSYVNLGSALESAMNIVKENGTYFNESIINN